MDVIAAGAFFAAHPWCTRRGVCASSFGEAISPPMDVFAAGAFFAAHPWCTRRGVCASSIGEAISPPVYVIAAGVFFAAHPWCTRRGVCASSIGKAIPTPAHVIARRFLPKQSHHPWMSLPQVRFLPHTLGAPEGVFAPVLSAKQSPTGCISPFL